MKYYQVDFHSDEIRRFRKQGVKPFVVQYVKTEYYAPFELDKGRWIDDWPNDVELRSCQDGELLTRLSNDSDMYLLSNEAIDLFNKNDIQGFQYLPVTIFKESGSILSGYQQVANIYNQVECLDLERSVYDYYDPQLRPDREGHIFIIRKFVLLAEKLKNLNLDIFRLSEQRVDILASERLVRLWNDNGFSNLAFKEVEVL